MNTMKWSAEQTAIFQHFADGSGNLVIEAFAGTGKTTTIKEAFTYVHPDITRILYAVFNKRNQKEAEAKIKDPRVEVKTLHSLGYAFIKRVWPQAKPDDAVEVDRILKQAPLAGNDEIAMALKLVGFAKNTCIKPTASDIIRIAGEQDIDLGERQDRWVAVTLAAIESAKVKDPAGRISFNDMVWLPVACAMVRPLYDLVCIDEAQDMNLPQLTMARQACKPSGRVVVVGDSRQAIYGFRGAVQNGMGMMKVTLAAKTLMLSATYRCPKAVVARAAQLVPDYKAASEAPEGLVSSLNESAMMGKLAVGDAILSRLNAPLMPLALSLLRKNIPARIEGRDIGKQLVGMIRSLKAKSIPDLMARLAAWEAKQTARLQDAKNAEKRIEQVHDIAATLSAIAESSSSVADCEARLNSLFEDTNEQSRPAVVLSSVHKAKGLEWHRVFLLSETFRASRGGEEANIYYVALTRSKAELYLVGGNSAPQEPEKRVASLPEGNPQPVKESAQLEKSNPQVTLFDNSEVPPGQTLRKVGDVFVWQRNEYVVEKVSASNAKARCLTKLARIKSDGTEGFEGSAQFITVSNCCDCGSVIRSEENFQPQKSGAAGINQKQTSGNGENNNMKKQTEVILTGIDLLIAKAIAGKKDDNKITAMCLSNYPEVPAGDVVKLIAQARKAAAKGQVVGKVQTAKAPAAKAPAAKTPKAEKAKTPSAEHPWAGVYAAERKLIEAGMTPQDAFKKLAKVYLKMTPGSFARDWEHLGQKKPNMDGVKCPARGWGNGATPAPAKKVAAPAPKAPAPKAAKPAAPAPKKVSPPAPKPAAEAPAENETEQPAE